ncbi:MAG: alpha/beta fold hydrolase [Dehalococcoidia bacterium]|nr:alpha/beta fold hydrolase [Dehalococcoidia bacterium]
MVESGKTTQDHVRFPASGIVLEGIFERPRGENPFPSVVVCHPHPLYGGDMYNNVVSVICQALGQGSVATLRFNFRGVGRSEGEHGEGIGEQDDVRAALDFLESRADVDKGRIGVAGYSFGTRVVMPVALRDSRVRAVALVSPFLADADWQSLKTYSIPKLFICGGEDNIISPHKVKRLAGEAAAPSECEVVFGADHFWWGFEGKIGRKVSDFFRSAFFGQAS